MDRRAVLAAGAGLAAAAAVPGGASAQSDDLDSWLSDANNYDEIVDHTGADEVTVEVGAAGGLAFGPAAIRVEPGTTVTWEWTGDGGPHNVAEVDGAFRSGEAIPDAGTTFEQTFESAGEFRYVCEPHETGGMKGAVVVEQGGPPPEVEEYLANTSNYDGLEDFTGQDEVTVEVGVGDDGMLFGPPAIQIDPGTTVVWEWTGQGMHNVAEVDGAFRSGDPVMDESTTFEHTFEEEGYALYVCDPHESVDMKGAVVVGGSGGAGGAGGGGLGAGDGGGTLGSSSLAAVLGVFLVPIAFALALLGKELTSEKEEERQIGHEPQR